MIMKRMRTGRLLNALQRRLEHFRNNIKLFTEFGVEEGHVRKMTGVNNCFRRGFYHRIGDWSNGKGEKNRGTSCAEVARICGKSEEPNLGKLI